MLSATIKLNYAKCHYGKCRYAECRGTPKKQTFSVSTKCFILNFLRDAIVTKPLFTFFSIKPECLSLVDCSSLNICEYACGVRVKQRL